jgi:SAM-dependent MidA family methyltransferase
MQRLDAFMARANAAYYARPGAIGGDFTTAPEISQAFGEVLGAWCAVMWERMGRPDPVILCECGPGRGTLMADALRALGAVAPDFRAALRLHLVETSPALRAAQRRALGEAVWHEDVASLPEGPMLLLANEFLDALPIRQFVWREGAWRERFVEAGAFVEIQVPPAPLHGGGPGCGDPQRSPDDPPTPALPRKRGRER